MIKHQTNRTNGFTIVELLIVIVVIGILAAITIVAYGGIQDKARNAKITTDVASLTRAIYAAQISSSDVLKNITGNSATGAGCWSHSSGTNLAALPPADSCWVNYNWSLNAISNASGINVRGLLDPWGRPYIIDENEGEGGGCSKDTTGVFKLPFTTGFGTYSTTPANNVPLSGFSGCAL